MYLLDESSAELDCEERVEAARVIKSFIWRRRKAAVVVEHEFVIATYLADSVVVFADQPSCECTAHPPKSISSGVNRFLKTLDITFRKHPTCFRPQLNKVGSSKDLDQKSVGKYSVVDD